MVDFSNPVPQGRANTGAAVVFGEGLGALRYLQHTDALRATAERAAALARQRQQDADARDFASRLKLSDEGGVHYMPLLKQKADKAYQDMQALVNDRSLTRSDRAVKQQQIRDNYDREAKASVVNDKYLADLGQRITADKRYDRTKTIDRLNNTLYQDGQVRSPLDYDPQVADQAINTGNEHLNGVEVFKQYLRGSHPDAVTSAREALPGGRGYRNVSSSDVYELTQEGKIKYDPATNLPVVKATPQALNYFDSDPVNRQYLDGFEQQHQAQLAGAVQKMQNQEQLTPEEAEAVRVEQSPAGRRMELFMRGLMEQGYGRTSETILQKAAPRPRVGRSTANQSVIMTGRDVLPGAVIGGEHGEASGVTSYGVLPALTYGKPGQQPKNFVGKNVKHQEVVTMANDGSPVVTTQSNQAAGDVSYGQRHIFLRSSKTGNVFLGTPAAVEAAKRGDFAASEAEARKFRAQHPEYKPEIYVESNPVGVNGVQAGNKEEYFAQLKAKEDAYRKAYSEGGTTAAQLAKDDPEAAKMERLAAIFGGGKSHPPRFYSDAELRDQASKEYARVSKSHYVRYSGTDKMQIDAATQYALRNPRARKVMENALADADRRTRPGLTEQQQAHAGRGPLAGLVTPAAAPVSKAPTTAQPAANPHGFKFKK